MADSKDQSSSVPESRDRAEAYAYTVLGLRLDALDSCDYREATFIWHVRATSPEIAAERAVIEAEAIGAETVILAVFEGEYLSDVYALNPTPNLPFD